MKVYLAERLCTADLLPPGDELQQVGLGMPHFIAQTLGRRQAAQHAAAHDGVLFTQAAAAVDGAHTPHLSSQPASLLLMCKQTPQLPNTKYEYSIRNT